MAIIIKTAEQIEGIRASSKLAAETLKYLEPFIRPGITTLEIDALADAFVQEHGGISADGEKRRDAEIHIAGIAAQDIPGGAEDDELQHHIAGEKHIAVVDPAGEGEDQRCDHQ